jgi:hypothetical protein
MMRRGRLLRAPPRGWLLHHALVQAPLLGRQLQAPLNQIEQCCQLLRAPLGRLLLHPMGPAPLGRQLQALALSPHHRHWPHSSKPRL